MNQTRKATLHLFAGSQYYPSRAMNDHRGVYETVEDAMDTVIKNQNEWYQIVEFHNDGTHTIHREG